MSRSLRSYKEGQERLKIVNRRIANAEDRKGRLKKGALTGLGYWAAKDFIRDIKRRNK